MNRSRFAIPCALACLALAGCSSNTTQTTARPDCFPTKGTLTYNDKPAAGATVMLWKTPVDVRSQESFRQVRPSGMVAEDGTFSLTTFDIDDGAMAGEYVVTVSWTNEGRMPGPDRLEGKFNNPQQPVATVAIKRGDNQLAPIKLTGDPVEPAAAIASGDL